MISTRIAIPLAALVLGTALGLGAGWKLYRPKAGPVETAAPAIRQPDKSLILERKPEAAPAPKHELPKGAKLERQIQVQVLPTIPTDAQRIPGSGIPSLSNPVQSASNPRLITVDLSLVKMPDGTQRVIASSPDGAISGGLDIPVGPPVPIVKDLHWEAGVTYNPSEHTYGGYLHRSLGPFVVGAQVFQERQPIQMGGTTKLEGVISLGIRW